MADKGRAGLREGIEHVVGEDFDVERRARCRDHHRAEAVDGGLNDNVGEGKDRALHARGNADAQNAPEACSIDAKQLPLNAHALVRVREAAVEKQRAHGV